MSDIKDNIWINGKYCKLSEVNISLTNHSFSYGMTVFDGIKSHKIENGKNVIFRLTDHVERLISSCDLLQIKLDYSRKQIVQVIKEMVREIDASLYIRPLVFLGDGIFSLNNKDFDINIAIIPFRTKILENIALNNKVKLKISPIQRVSSLSVPTKAKVSGNYLNSKMTIYDAKKDGFDDGIMLDYFGNVAECSVQNILFETVDGKICFPESDSSLNGLTINSVSKIAEYLGYNVISKEVTPNEIKSAKAVAVSSTAGGIRMVRQIDQDIFNTDDSIILNIIDVYNKVSRGENKSDLFSKWVEFI